MALSGMPLSAAGTHASEDVAEDRTIAARRVPRDDIEAWSVDEVPHRCFTNARSIASKNIARTFARPITFARTIASPITIARTIPSIQLRPVRRH